MKILSKIMAVGLLFILDSCTYSVNLIHTEGGANDVIDEQQTPSTTISPRFSVPNLLARVEAPF
jgi:hypothetical protein